MIEIFHSNDGGYYAEPEPTNPLIYVAQGIDGQLYEGRYIYDSQDKKHYILVANEMHMIKYETLHIKEYTEEENMSTISKSYEDPVEIVKERKEENSEVYISPRYKGKNPKTPEQLKAEREARKAKKINIKDGLYESEDKMVSHPSHYQVGKYEALDIIQEATKDLTGIFAIDTGHILRYILRWNKKGSARQNIEKAIFYCTHLLKALDESETNT